MPLESVGIIAGMLLLALAAAWIAAERGSLLRSSTRRFFKESGFGLNAIHGYIYGRWTNRYVRFLLSGMPSADRGAATRLADHYHGKILTHDHAAAIVHNHKDIPLTDLDQVIPYPVARKIVLKGPPDVAAFECACRHARPSHCQPTRVCMVVGQPVVDFVLEHQPRASRRLTQAEALELLEAEHRRGHVHCAWFKDAMLDRFYAICNCCKCCCGGIEAMVKGGTRILAASGYVARHDDEACASCETCVETCAFAALAMNGNSVAVDWERCMGCGACEAVCPSQAITLVRDERKGIPLDVRALAGA